MFQTVVTLKYFNQITEYMSSDFEIKGKFIITYREL